MNSFLDNAEISDDCFNKYLQLIHALTGITIAKGRKTMLQARLSKRINFLKLDSYETYIKLINSSKEEQKVFINLITTNETYFFRTPKIWSYIENQFLQSWYNLNQNKKLNIWSAAASSGEEAYSLSILCNQFKEKNQNFDFQIIGTDISSEMIEKCSMAIYNEKSIENLKKDRSLFHEASFRKDANGLYLVQKKLKEKVSFFQHNLFEELRFDIKFDLVLLRNVLIYFVKEDQERVIEMVLRKMSKNGILIIGESESLSFLKTECSYIEPLIYKSAG